VKILGISGTNGAGKDSVGEYLAKKHGWHFVSVTDILREEAVKRGLPPDRHSTHMISAEWRRSHGLGVLIDKAVEAYKTEKKHYKGLAIASLRNPGEADEVHRLGGKVIWIDADPKTRHQRVINSNRGRIDDQKTFEEFITEEQHQMRHSGDKATLSMEGVKAKADLFLDNNGHDIEMFFKELEKLLDL